MFRRKQNDLEILKTLAEYRLLTLSQLTVLQFSGKQVASRRLAQMANQGFVETIQRGLGQGRGRPENLFGVTPAGAQLLRDETVLRHSVSPDKVTGSELVHCEEHQLLVNWFRIHLMQIEKVLPNLKVRFLVPTSPFLAEETGIVPWIKIENPAEEDRDQVLSFTPDGVFAITDTGQGNKTVLFFLEVDMGTETLAAPEGNGKDIRQKVINYQTCFRLRSYKRFERGFGFPLNGFRLLFLAHDYARAQDLCRLVQEMRPSDFIWVTDQDRIFDRGLADAIWSRGGRQENPPQSLLNHRTCRPSPVLPIKS